MFTVDGNASLPISHSLTTNTLPLDSSSKFVEHQLAIIVDQITKRTVYTFTSIFIYCMHYTNHFQTYHSSVLYQRLLRCLTHPPSVSTELSSASLSYNRQKKVFRAYLAFSFTIYTVPYERKTDFQM